MLLKIQKLDPIADSNIKLPSYATKGSAGMDIRSNVLTEIPANNGIRTITTGLRFQIPRGWEVQIRSRSGLASHGVIVANSPGTIDSDYRGEIKIILLNTGYLPFLIRRGMRIAQIIPKRVERIIIQQVEHISTDTERGNGGQGSTRLM